MNLPDPNPPEAAAPMPPPTGAAERGRRSRLVPVLIVVIAALAATALGVWSLAISKDEETVTANRPATLVQVDPERGELLVHDDLGTEVTATFELSDGGFPTALGDGRLYDVSALEAGELRLYDVAAGTSDEFRVSEGAGFAVPLGDHLVVVGATTGLGDLEIVDTSTGDVDGLADALDLETRWSIPLVDAQAGAFAALGVDGEPVRAIVPATGLDGAWTVDDRVLDLWSGERALVAIGADAPVTLAMVGPDGVVGETAEMDAVVVGGVAIGEEAALVVDLEGSLWTFDAERGTVAETVELDVGEVERVWPLLRDRILVVGRDATVLLDGEGATMGTWKGQQLDVPSAIGPGVHCIALRPSDGGSVDPGGVLVDLGNGAELVTLDGRPLQYGDGCSFIVFGADGDQVVIGGEEIDLGDNGRVAGVDPLGGRVLVIDGDRRYRLIDTEGETVAELGDGPWILVS